MHWRFEKRTNIKDLTGCSSDGLVTSTQLFDRWKNLLSSYLER